MTFAVAAGRRHRQRRRDPPANGVGDRVLADRPDPAAARPRRQDVRRLRLPERGADAQVRDPGRRRQGRLQGRDARHARRTRRSTRSRSTSRSRSRRGRASRPASAASSCATSSSPTTASRTSTRSSLPATGSGWRRTRTRRGGSSRRRCAASQFAADQPDEAAAILVAENPGVFDANKELPKASQRVPRRTAAICVDAQGRFGTQTLERWQGYSDFLYRPGPPDRWRRASR